MTIDAEEQTNSGQEVGPTDLKSKLRCILVDEFKKRLIESELISEEQCKRLSNLLVDESISAPAIIKALTGHEESPADD
jgi:hypothetical protein